MHGTATPTSTARDPESDTLEPVFKALADPTRRAILARLRVRRHTTGELSESFPDLTRFAVMKHLRVLESAGRVVSSKDGRQRWNTINAVPLRRLYERWVSRYADLWATGLTRLQDLVERPTPTETNPQTGTDMPTIEMTQARVAHLQQELTIAAPVEQTFKVFVERCGEWFASCARPGENVMRLQPRVGGLMFEDYGDGAGMTLATITHFIPNQRIGMSGEFCGNEACLSNVFFDFQEADNGTLIKMSHHMAGEVSDQHYAEFDAGWTELFERFKKLVETGSAD